MAAGLSDWPMSEVLAAGAIRKLRAELADPVRYWMRFYRPGAARPHAEIAMNALIGQPLRLSWSEAQIHCVHCGRSCKKSFNQGYCYPCFQRLAQCDACIVKPELCHFAQGTCREPDWGEAHCNRPHYVYCANSSGLKVGITRDGQIPTRWIDQGASQALPMMRVDTRYQSGLVETALKAHVADRTDWRKMLKGDPEPLNLAAERDRLIAAIRAPLADLRAQFGAAAIAAASDDEVTGIRYPVTAYPKTVKSLNLDKTPVIEATLTGIKGQYLIFDTGVINVRKYGGYQLTLAVCDKH